MTKSTLTPFLFLLLMALSAPVTAMEVKVVGDQLIMSGPIDGTEIVRLRDVAAELDAARIKTVVLRDSQGGHLWTAIRVGEYIRDKGWRTAVSGYCFSACAIAFLGGVERHFTDDKPIFQTQLAFHAAYNTTDNVSGYKDSLNRSAAYTARQWIKTSIGGKVSDDMLDRLEKLEKTEFIHFFDSSRMAHAALTAAFVCSHAEQDAKKKCKLLAGADVYREGIVTSPVLIRANDQPASLPLAPSGSTPRLQEPAK